MAITDNGKLEYESGQALQAWEAMDDSGDHQSFEASFAPWSARAGFETNVRPYGIATGGVMTPGTGDNSVDVAALTAYMPGSSASDTDGLVSVAGNSVSVTRASAGTDPYRIVSITVDSTGALAAVDGTDGTAFSETRGGSGGPPYIPVDSVEIGQVRMSSETAAPIGSSEIFQVVGAHQERFDQPVWDTDTASGEVHFASPLPKIHTGDLPKQVWVTGYTPIFAEIPRVSDWVPADESHSVNSTEIYGGTLGSVSRSLQQASFTHYGNDGITDPLIKIKNQNLWFRWFQDRARTAYSLTQGVLGISRTYPAGDHVQISATISAESSTVDFEG